MKCQYCGSEIPDNFSFCPNCGQKAVSPENGPEKKFCDSCGASLEPGRAFCPNCGKPASGDTQQSSSFSQGTQPYAQPYNGSASDAGQQPVKKKTGLIIAIVVICLVVLAGIGAAAGFLIFSGKEDWDFFSSYDNSFLCCLNSIR